MSNTVTFLGSLLNPKTIRSLEFTRNGALAVDRDGKIVDYGRAERLSSRFSGDVRDFRGRLIVPGFVDMHAHLSQLDLAGVEVDGFYSWLERFVYPLESKFANSDFAREKSRQFFRNLVANGTTTAGVITSVHERAADIAFEEAERAGIRVIMGKAMTDLGVPEDSLEKAEESVAASVSLCTKWHNRAGGRLKYSFVPRSATGCTAELMKATAIQAKRHSAYVQTHLSENLDELAEFAAVHPSFKSYTEAYYGTGLLGPRTILSHAVYLSRRELNIIKRTNSAIAHCPGSSLFLRGGIFNVRERLNYGLRIGLGSDIGGGPDLSMFKVMKTASLASKAQTIDSASAKQVIKKYRTKAAILDTKAVFYLATLGGARALGLSNEIGSFRKGKSADFVVVDPEQAGLENWEVQRSDPNILVSRLIHLADDRAISNTYVMGREVYAADT